MNAIASIALSGMNAAQQRLGASAHNIANTLTPGFRRQLVVQQSVAEGGVATRLAPSEFQGPALAEDVVAQMSAAYQFITNLKVIQTQDRLLGSLIDRHA